MVRTKYINARCLGGPIPYEIDFAAGLDCDPEHVPMRVNEQNLAFGSDGNHRRKGVIGANIGKHGGSPMKFRQKSINSIK